MNSADRDHVRSPPRSPDEINETRDRELFIRRIQKTIEDEFNLEILLKHRELGMIDDEMAKCEAQMIALRNHYEIAPDYSLAVEPTNFTRQYLTLLQESFLQAKSIQLAAKSVKEEEQAPKIAESGYRTRSQTSSLRPVGMNLARINECLYRRADGVLVKLTCHQCGRCNFSSAQGFLNHNRIAHGREFVSQDDAALMCGTALEDAEQDSEGLAALSELRARGQDVDTNLASNAIEITGVKLYSPDLRSKPLFKKASCPSTEVSNRKRSKQEVPEKMHKDSKADHLKQRYSALLGKAKGDKFDDILREITAEVKDPHLFENEEEIKLDEIDKGKLRQILLETGDIIAEAKKLNMNVEDCIKLAIDRKSGNFSKLFSKGGARLSSGKREKLASKPGAVLASRMKEGSSSVSPATIPIEPTEKVNRDLDLESGEKTKEKSKPKSTEKSKDKTINRRTSKIEAPNSKKKSFGGDHYNLRSTTRRAKSMDYPRQL